MKGTDIYIPTADGIKIFPKRHRNSKCPTKEKIYIYIYIYNIHVQYISAPLIQGGASGHEGSEEAN